ncbi:KGG domain-containing protein [Noviherbaspirillum pedocola]|nr:KGG domain-containing protein [Noviherbaspirillum pedocola]
MKRRIIMANNQQGGNGQDKRGFASMDPNKQREIASEGGRAAHRSGNAHEFTSEEARAAGQLSHKNDGGSGSSGNRGNETSNTRGGSSEQHAEAGRQSHKNSGNQQSGSRGNESTGMRGGSSEQHAKAGSQSHKNQK